VRLDPTGLHPIHDLLWSGPRSGQLSGELRLAREQGALRFRLDCAMKIAVTAMLSRSTSLRGRSSPRR